MDEKIPPIFRYQALALKMLKEFEEKYNSVPLWKLIEMQDYNENIPDLCAAVLSMAKYIQRMTSDEEKS